MVGSSPRQHPDLESKRLLLDLVNLYSEATLVFLLFHPRLPHSGAGDKHRQGQNFVGPSPFPSSTLVSILEHTLSILLFSSVKAISDASLI